MNALVNFTKIFKFNGGVHPPENKTQSTQLPIGQLPLPATLVLPLRQHVGNIPKVKVNVGDQVLKGQLLAEAEGTVSAAIHAPTSGNITAIEDAIIPHPSGLPYHCITITPDGKDQWIKRTPQDWRNAERKDLVASLRLSGIVGLGGATFPTHIKLRADGKSGIHTLVINAAECEPYITCDDMLMRERADEIVKGIEIAQYLLGAQKVMIGIEDNKPEATKAMQAATENTGMEVIVVPTLYPSGDARRLVHLLLGTEIPHDKRSTEVGLQVFNVATVLALYRYFEFGEPAISRIVSMTGNIQTPQNFEVLFGTPLLHLVAAAGGAKNDTTHYIMGGPMMASPVGVGGNSMVAAPVLGMPLAAGPGFQVGGGGVMTMATTSPTAGAGFGGGGTAAPQAALPAALPVLPLSNLPDAAVTAAPACLSNLPDVATAAPPLSNLPACESDVAATGGKDAASPGAAGI
jgi:electron transport complex protein RnfC